MTAARHSPGPRALLVSDVDSTFLTQEVIELVAEHAGTRAEVEEVTTRAMRGELDFAQSLRERVRTLAGLDEGVLAEVRAALVPTPGALELVARAREAGFVTALVSGGFHEAIDELARDAGIDHVLANRFEIEDGHLTGRVTGPIVDARTKRRTLLDLAAQHGIPLARTVAVGDGANDALMVQAAGVGIAFRAKPALAEVADVRLDGPSLLDAWPHLEAALHAEPAPGEPVPAE
jgi:phosphoserine phosphatase